MLLFVTGASGSGKTAVIPGLTAKFPEYSIHDFDERGVPEGADTRWRQEQTEFWISKSIGNQHLGQDTIICGGAVYGEILACPSIRQIDGLGVCLLDCSDIERIRRIRSSNGTATMELLSWSAWLRVHAGDPEWYPRVITRQGYKRMNWQNWQQWKSGDPRWQVKVIDTSSKKINQIVGAVVKWVDTQVSSDLALNLDRKDEDDILPEDHT